MVFRSNQKTNGQGQKIMSYIKVTFLRKTIHTLCIFTWIRMFKSESVCFKFHVPNYTSQKAGLHVHWTTVGFWLVHWRWVSKVGPMPSQFPSHSRLPMLVGNPTFGYLSANVVNFLTYVSWDHDNGPTLIQRLSTTFPIFI